MSIKIFNKKIKYVALGDSISEGFNSYYNFGYAGSMKANKKITGTSWPAYFARYIQKIDKNILESYDNFAISGTRPEDWNYFLGLNNEKYNYKNSVNKIEFGKKLDNRKNNPEKGRISKLFKNFGKENENDFNLLHKKIKNSNLITINIGANYLIPKFSIDDVQQWIMDEKVSNDDIKRKFIKIISSLKNDMSVMIKQIKKLNSTTNIYLISYPVFFTPLYRTFNELFFKLGFDEELMPFLYKQMNEQIKNIAIKNKINYIDVSNNIFWKKHQTKLTKIFFDIHPTEFGYKKIAQDVFLKISLSNAFFQQNNLAITKSISSFTSEYINKDKNCFKNGIDFNYMNYSDDLIIKKIIGKNHLTNLFAKSSIENEVKKLNVEIDFEQYLSSQNHLNGMLQKNFFSFLNSINLKPNTKIYEQINILFKDEILINFIIESKLLSYLMQMVQNELEIYYKSHGDISNINFISLCIDKIFSIDFIFILFKELSNLFKSFSKQKLKTYKTNFISLVNEFNNGSKIKKLLVIILSFIIEPILITNKIKIDSKYLNNVLNNYINKKNIQNILLKIINFWFDNFYKISNFKHSTEVVLLMLKSESIFEYSEFIGYLLKQKNILNEISIFICKKFGIKKILKNQIIIEKFIVSLFDYLNSNYLLNKIWKKLFLEFLVAKNNIFSLQNVLNFLLLLEKSEFVKYRSSKNISIKKERILLNSIVDGFNLILDNIKFDQGTFRSIINLKPTWHIFETESKKINILNIIKIIQKILYLDAPMNDFLNSLYDEFKKNNSIKDKYLKFYFRLLIILLLIFFKLFKTKDGNIFWSDKNVPTIAKTIIKLCGYKKSNDKNMKKLILNILGEENNENLIRNCNEKNYETNRVLWYIFSMEKIKFDKLTNMDKEIIFFESLKKGYWILNKKEK